MIYGGEKEYTKIEVKEIKDGDVIWEWHGEKDIDEHIVKVKGGYELKSKHGNKNLGKYPTKAGAEKREREVQYFKHAGESIEESNQVNYKHFSTHDLLGMLKTIKRDEHGLKTITAISNELIRRKQGVDEGFQDFNRVEPYAVCLAGKPVKKFDYYEDARRFHDNWKKKLYNQGDKAKAEKITLMPLNLDEGDDLGNLDAEVFGRIDKEKQRRADLKKNDPAAYAKEMEKDSKNYGRGIMGALRRKYDQPLDEAMNKNDLLGNVAKDLNTQFKKAKSGKLKSDGKDFTKGDHWQGAKPGDYGYTGYQGHGMPVDKKKVNEFAPGGTMKPPAPPTAKKKDPFEDDDRSQLLMSIKNLLDKGAKIDSYLFGARGHITGVANDYFGFYFKKLNKPHSKSSFVRPMDGEDDESYMLKLVKPGYYQLWDKSIANAGEQGVAEGIVDTIRSKNYARLADRSAAKRATALDNFDEPEHQKQTDIMKQRNLKSRLLNKKGVAEGTGPQSKLDQKIIHLLTNGIPADAIARKLDIPVAWVDEVAEYNMPDSAIDYNDPRNTPPTNRFGEGVVEGSFAHDQLKGEINDLFKPVVLQIVKWARAEGMTAKDLAGTSSHFFLDALDPDTYDRTQHLPDNYFNKLMDKANAKAVEILKKKGVAEAETDYSKRRQREKDVDAGKPVARQRQSKMTDYQKRRAQQKKEMELGESINYWTKLQNERNTKLNSLVDELKESIKK